MTDSFKERLIELVEELEDKSEYLKGSSFDKNADLYSLIKSL